MAIPLVVTPEFVTEIPSTKQQIRFRPFVVKEEKILFMAMEGGDPVEINTAVKKVLTNCILSDDLDIDKLATFDIEYLFLQLRGKSVGEVIELNLKHPGTSECHHVTEFGVKIDDIKVQFPENISDKIMINDSVGLKMNYPSLETSSQVNNNTGSDLDTIIELIANHVQFVFDNDNVYEEFTKQEVKDFIESMNSTQFKNLTDFFTDGPELRHEISWTCQECGKQESLMLRGLQSFFT